MASKNLVVAMVGAGIGGLSTTLALLRAGVDVTCFERSSSLRESGAGIQIGPNASRVLMRLGLGSALEAVGVKPVAIEIRRWNDGHLLRRVTGHPAIEQLFGAPYFTFHRAELHAALRDALPREAVRVGTTCVEVNECTDGIELRFGDGSSFRADAVIGADGLRSTLRASIQPGLPRFAGKMACRVLVPAAEVAGLADPPTVRMWLGPGKHVVSYPVSAGTLLNLAVALPARDEDVESWTREGEVGEMIEGLRGWDPAIQRVLQSARSTLRLPLFDRAPLQQTGRGRLSLLGDAAHPMLPFFAQGASQAIEDAWVLSRCLQGVRARDVTAALRRYENARHSRVTEVQRRSIRNGRLFQLPRGVRQWARDLMLRRLTLESFSWLYGHDVDRVPI